MIVSNLSNKDYHAMTEVVSNSYLQKMATVPAAAKVPDTDSDEKLFGRAFHCLMLDSKEVFDSLFAIMPDGINLRTNDGKKELERLRFFNPGKDILTPDQYNLAVDILNAVITHPTAAILLSEGISEQSVFWTDEETGLPCRCRPDRIPDGDHGVILDIKTARDASKRAFTNAIVNFGYHAQAAFYLDGYNAASGKKADSFIFIAIEKKLPYRTEVYVIDDDFINVGRHEYRRLLAIEKACREGNYYPNYLTTDIQELTCPNWVR